MKILLIFVITVCIFQRSFIAPDFLLSKMNVVFNVGDVVQGVVIFRWVLGPQNNMLMVSFTKGYELEIVLGWMKFMVHEK